MAHHLRVSRGCASRRPSGAGRGHGSLYKPPMQNGPHRRWREPHQSSSTSENVVGAWQLRTVNGAETTWITAGTGISVKENIRRISACFQRMSGTNVLVSKLCLHKACSWCDHHYCTGRGMDRVECWKDKRRRVRGGVRERPEGHRCFSILRQARQMSLIRHERHYPCRGWGWSESSSVSKPELGE